MPLIVLDRPNPLGGLRFEGAIRLEKWKSFIGWGPMPVSHGMTFGEVARFYKDVLSISCDLTVVPMQGWKRTMTWEDTGLHWVQTSPHIPHALQAHLYIATGMLGGITKNINEGVGYTLPFETIAAEFIEAGRFCEELTRAKLPGVQFRPISYRPYYHRHAKQDLSGAHLILTDPHTFRPLETALTALVTLEKLYPGQTIYKGKRNFAIHWGAPKILEQIKQKTSPRRIMKSWKRGLDRFAKQRKRALLYP